MRRILPLLFLVCSFWTAAQNDSVPVKQPESNTQTQNVPQDNLPPAAGDLFKPTIGIGTGMFSFYGDLYSKNYQAPWTSRVAYDLNISQPLNNSMRVNFYVLFGKLGANERIDDKRYVNFESMVRLGGLNVMYTFDHLFKQDYRIRPWVSLGFEGVEFLSKTDLFDRFGNRYYYWSDGSIRNMDENASGAKDNAIELVRDYTYESDIRELNLDNFGKYPERTWGIPIGGGALFKIGERFEMKMGATFHYTFTDYIDGVTNESLGNRAGNKRKDCFVMTSFSLHYDLVTKSKTDTMPEDYWDPGIFAEIDKDDADGDGVRDFDDKCHGTPAGATVNKDGCGVDTDGDQVADHKDDEAATPEGNTVDGKGVTYTEERGAKWYELYYDSTGANAQTELIGNVYKNEPNRILDKSKPETTAKEFVVELGKFSGGVPEDVMMFLLSIGDVKSTNQGDAAIYTAGNYDNINTALARKSEFVDEGIKDVKIGVYENGQYRQLTEKEINDEIVKAGGVGVVTPKTNLPGDTLGGNALTTHKVAGTVFRVQLGAYRNRISKLVFGKAANNVIEIPTDNGFYRYTSGAYTSLEQAAKHRADLILEGFPDAFITAYKDGKRVTLSEVGATYENKKDEKDALTQQAQSQTNTSGAIDKSLVSYTIQLGGVKKNASPEFEEQIKNMKDVNKQVTITGYIRYTAGKFSDYNEAVKYKNQLVQEGYSDAFVIATFKGEVISLQEAWELQK